MRKRKLLSLLCECGCGEFAEPGNRFINGHNTRGISRSLETRRKMSMNNGKKHKRKPLTLLCACGCDQYAKPGRTYIHGHNGRGKEGWSKGLSKEMDRRIRKASEFHKGRKAWNKGRKNTEEEKKRQKEIMRQYFIEHPEDLELRRKKAIERSQDLEVRKKISNTVSKLWQDKDYRKKLRLAHANRARRQGQSPSYNELSCKFFSQFDRDFNTQGQYATNGGEYFIKALGYWMDYINFDLKLIIEWDERSHYDVDGNLKERDVQRQREIQEYFPDFTFVRIRQEEIDDFDEGMDLVDQAINSKTGE